MEHLPATTPARPERLGAAEDPRMASTVVGAWWRVRDSSDALARDVDPMPAHGVVLPIVAVHVLDGAIHSVDLHLHPRAGKGTVRLRLDDLWARCDMAEDGAALRAAEQTALLGEMGQAQARLASGPDPIALQHLLAHAPAPAAAPAAPQAHLPAALTGGRDAQGMAIAAQEALAVAAAHARWAQDVAEDMGRLGKILTRFQTEQVAVITGKAEAMGAHARSTLERLDTLTLFLGERQRVTTLTEGRSAPADAPLHLYQQMLYLDEELAVAWPDPEGFTWDKGMGAFDALLAQHPAIVDRMLPQPRSVAIARVRREPRKLSPNADIGAIFASIEQADWDTTVIVLVRDGERVSMIEADKDLEGAERLFPSRAEIDALYHARGWHSGGPISITPDDLGYVESRAKHAQKTLFYTRFLVLLWGLHARTGLFGPFMPTDSNWFDPSVQARYLRFVHDEEMGLDAPGPGVLAWMAAGVERAGKGTRVAIDADVATQRGYMPGAYADLDRGVLKGTPTEPYMVLAVESDGLDRYLSVPMREGKRVIKRRLLLSDNGKPSVPHGMVAWDAATAAACQRHLDSRRDRRHYTAYVPLLRWLVPRLQARDADLLAMGDVHNTAIEGPAWTAARASAGRASTARLRAAQRAIEAGIRAAQADGRPHLIDPKGTAHPILPWRHSIGDDVPHALWQAGDQVFSTHHPAPCGWTQVGDLAPPAAHAALGAAFQRLDLPGWYDSLCTPVDADGATRLFLGQNPDGAAALLGDFVRTNLESRDRHVQHADLVWTVGMGVATRHGQGKALLCAVVADPIAVALQTLGLERVQSELARIYKDPAKAIARAATRTVHAVVGDARPRGWARAVPHPHLDWKGDVSGNPVQPLAPDSALGQDGKALLMGTFHRPSEFYQGGHRTAAYLEQARGARFWLRSDARALLAPLFEAASVSEDGISWSTPTVPS